MSNGIAILQQLFRSYSMFKIQSKITINYIIPLTRRLCSYQSKKTKIELYLQHQPNSISSIRPAPSQTIREFVCEFIHGSRVTDSEQTFLCTSYEFPKCLRQHYQNEFIRVSDGYKKSHFIFYADSNTRYEVLIKPTALAGQKDRQGFSN